MPRFGEELARAFETISRGARPSVQDLEGLRLAANQIDGAVQSIRSAPSGGLSADAFVGRAFGVLPHECAGMISTGAYNVEDSVFTGIGFTEGGAVAADLAVYEYSHGMRRDYAVSSRGLIWTDNVPAGSVALSWGVVRFPDLATGKVVLGIKTTTDDVGTFAEIPAMSSGGSGGLDVQVVDVRRCVSGNGGFYLTCWQNSGSSVAISWRRFSVARLR